MSSEVKAFVGLACATAVAAGAWYYYHRKISKVAASETDGEPPLDEKQTIAALRLCMKSTREAVNSSAQQVMKMQGRLPPQQLDQVFSQVLQQALVASDQKVFAELKVSPDDLVASTDYWQDKSGQVLMLSESIKNSLVQFLGPPPSNAKVPEDMTEDKFVKIFNEMLKQQRALFVNVCNAVSKSYPPKTPQFVQVVQGTMAKESQTHKVEFLKKHNLSQDQFRACATAFDKSAKINAVVQAHMQQQKQLEVKYMGTTMDQR